MYDFEAIQNMETLKYMLYFLSTPLIIALLCLKTKPPDDNDPNGGNPTSKVKI